MAAYFLNVFSSILLFKFQVSTFGIASLLFSTSIGTTNFPSCATKAWNVHFGLAMEVESIPPQFFWSAPNFLLNGNNSVLQQGGILHLGRACEYPLTWGVECA